MYVCMYIYIYIYIYIYTHIGVKPGGHAGFAKMLAGRSRGHYSLPLTYSIV